MSGASRDHLRSGDKFAQLRIEKFAGVVGAPAGNQDSPIIQQGRGMPGAALRHLRAGTDRAMLRIEEFAGIDRAAPHVWRTASDQNAAVLQQRSCVIDPIVTELTANVELTVGRMVDLDLPISASRD